MKKRKIRKLYKQIKSTMIKSLNNIKINLKINKIL